MKDNSGGKNMSFLKDVVEKLESNDEDIRLSAIEDIVDNNTVEAIPYLLRRLPKEDSILIKETIIFALKNLDCSGAYQQLFYLFKSPDAYLRNSAISIFASSGDKAVNFLSSRFNNEDREVKKLIIDTLFKIGTHSSILAIRPAIRDAAINVKMTAIEYLGRLGDYDSIPEILDILRNTDHPMLAFSIVEALLNLNDKKALEKALDILIPEGNIDAIDPVLKPEVLKISGRLGRTNLLLTLLERLEDIEDYAGEIISTIEELDEESLGELLSYPKIQGILLDIVKGTSIEEDIRYKAGEYILKIESLPSETLFDIGMSLLTAGDSLKVLGINLIGISRHAEAKKILLEVIEYTNDELIKGVCLETLSLLE